MGKTSRKQRILQDVQKKRRQRTIASIIVGAVLVSIIVGGIYALTRPQGNSGFPFPCLKESTTLHVHPYLQIIINNQNVTIPANIGIQTYTTGTCFEPIHTHDASGIIHLEASDINNQYTLGDFFKIWRVSFGTALVNGAVRPVAFNQTDILGFNNDQTHTVRLIVDGHNDTTSWGSLNLNKLDYCRTSMGFVAPCYPTANNRDPNTGLPTGDPYYGGQSYPYGTDHTIKIEY